MAWTDLTFGAGSVLTATKMTQLDENFDALGAQNAGAPLVTFPNSVLSANAGLQSTGVGSIATVHAESGFLGPQVSSFAAVHVGSGVVAPEVSSFGRVVTRHGTAEADSTGIGSFDNTEMTLLTISLDVLGNQVMLMGYLAVATNPTGVGVTQRIRVGSLGGTEVTQGYPGAVSAIRIDSTIFGFHTPSSGPASYVLTAINDGNADVLGVINPTSGGVRLAAVELPMA